MPRFDINNDDDRKRLCDALKWSHDQMKPYRERALKAWQLYTGHQYGDGDEKEQFINLMAQAVDTFVDRLASNSPRGSFSAADGSPHARSIRPAARKLQTIVNNRLKNARFEKVVQCVVGQALFGMGAVKIHLRDAGTSSYGGETVYRTEPVAEPILMEDMVVDMKSKSHETYGYIGHRYERYEDEALEDPGFTEEGRAALRAAASQTPDPDSLSTLGVNRSTEGCYVPQVKLWDVYLKRENLLVTLTGDFGHVLQVRKWKGPPRGPILPLYLRYVPGNAMPRGFALDLASLAETANELYRKLVRQAKRQKTLTACREGDEANLTTAKSSMDGGLYAFKDPQTIGEKRFGGADAGNAAFLEKTIADFVKYAGNLDILSGLGAQSQTLGQDQILNANSSRLVEAYSKTVVDWVSEVIQQFAWYLWTDPIEHYPIEIMAGNAVRVDDVLSPEERESFSFYDMNLQVDPYSLSAQTPAGKYQAITGILTQVLMPLQPLMQQQGIGLDMQELLKQVSELLGLPDLMRILTQQGQPMDIGTATPPEGRVSTAGKPNGEYIRRNIGVGKSDADMAQQRIQAMQQAEAAA